jgi:hypothetical protein
MDGQRYRRKWVVTSLPRVRQNRTPNLPNIDGHRNVIRPSPFPPFVTIPLALNRETAFSDFRFGRFVKRFAHSSFQYGDSSHKRNRAPRVRQHNELDAIDSCRCILRVDVDRDRVPVNRGIGDRESGRSEFVNRNDTCERLPADVPIERHCEVPREPAILADVRFVASTQHRFPYGCHFSGLRF